MVIVVVILTIIWRIWLLSGPGPLGWGPDYYTYRFVMEVYYF